MNDNQPPSLTESANETGRHHHHHETDKEALLSPTEQRGTETLEREHASDTFDDEYDDDDDDNNDDDDNSDKANNFGREFDLNQPTNRAVVASCIAALVTMGAIVVVALMYATGLLSDGLDPTPQPSLGPSMRPSPSPSSQLSDGWLQVGSDIVGETRFDKFGSVLAMSSNGTVLAIGTPLTDGGLSGYLNHSGLVRIFDFSGQEWVQRGADLGGDGIADYFGSSVSMSRDGSVVAVGAGRHDGVGGRDSGRVRVFVWDGSSWVTRGSPLDGEAARHVFGGDGDGLNPPQSVSLSDDGAVVAVGAPGRGGNKNIIGRLRIFDWNGVDWIQRGSALLGAGLGDRFGHAVSVSSDGNIVACGAYSSNPSHDPSYVRVFHWTGTMWTQLGTDIQGQKSNDNFGQSLSISGDGMVVAVGAPAYPYSKAYCRVFEFDGNEWVQLGQTIEGGGTSRWIGVSVSMSRSGDRLVVGSPGDQGSGVKASGHAKVFRLTLNRRWLQLGNDLLPSTPVRSYFGFAVAVSDDEPFRVAIGGPEGAYGWARVYQAV